MGFRVGSPVFALPFPTLWDPTCVSPQFGHTGTGNRRGEPVSTTPFSALSPRAPTLARRGCAPPGGSDLALRLLLGLRDAGALAAAGSACEGRDHKRGSYPRGFRGAHLAAVTDGRWPLPRRRHRPGDGRAGQGLICAQHGSCSGVPGRGLGAVRMRGVLSPAAGGGGGVEGR